MDKKALTFFINEWDGRKSDEDLNNILTVTIEGGIVDDLTDNPLHADEVTKFIENMRNPKFMAILMDYINHLGTVHNPGPSILERTTTIHKLIALFLKLTSNENTADVNGAYLDISMKVLKIFTRNYNRSVFEK